jgi:hypothetical protein
MKRTLSLVLALVMVLGMIPVYAQAATPQEEAGKLLEQLGVLKGDQNGNLMLDKTLLRRDAVVMLARLLGEEEVAEKYPTAPTWKDVTIKYYVPFLGWAQAEGYYKGYNDAKFGFTDDITVQDYALVLLRALGYTDVEWEDAYTKAKDLGLLEGVTLDATAKLPRGNMSVMTVTALNTKVKDSEKTLAETLEIEMPAEFAMTAKATGAKKITVTFNKAVDKTKAVIEISRGTVKPAVKSTTWSADNKSAVVEFNANLVAGDYTAKVTGLTDEALTATFKVEAAKLTSIEIKGDTLVMDKTNKNTARVGVVAKNQYGEEVSAVGLNISSSKGTGSISNGILTLNAGSVIFTVGEKVTVTIVDPTTGVAGVKTLTVAYGAQVSEVTIGELTTVDTNLVDKPINVARLNSNIDKYYIPVEVKDVAGNVLKAAELNTGNIEIITSNKQILNPDKFITTADGKTAIGLKAADAPQMAGTVVITVVSYGTGKTASATLKVLDNAKIDAVTVAAPSTDLKQEKAVTLPVTVVDTYGNELALKDVEITNTNDHELSFNAGEATLTVSNAKLAVKMNYATGVKTIEITPDANATQVNLTSVSRTGKVQTLSLAVLAKPYPVEIKGMGSDFVSVLANTTDSAVSTNIDDNIVFLDQYGEEIYVPYGDASEAYYYTVNPTSGSATVLDSNTEITVKSGANAVTDNYTVKLMKNGTATPVDTLDVAVQVVNLSDITEFVIDDMNKVYTGTTDRQTGHNQTVTVYGMYNGKKAAVPQSVIVAVSDNAGLTDATYTTTTGAITNGTDKTATITVLVSNGSTNKTLTKEVVYSDAAPKAQSIAAYSNGTKKTTEINITTSGSVTFDLNSISSSNSIYFKATDQYGVARVGSAMRYAVTDRQTGVSASVSGGTLTVSGSGSFVLSAFCDGLMTQIQVNVN